MHAAISHLQSAIRTSLQKGQLYRIYQDSLTACWPNLSDESRAARVAEFAAQNRWSVCLRNTAHLGLMAEFTKLEVAEG
jgi:hypothetical protein